MPHRPATGATDRATHRFSTATVDRQELLDATTRAYGPDEHAISADLPGGGGNGD